jgi:putative transposase
MLTSYDESRLSLGTQGHLDEVFHQWLHSLLRRAVDQDDVLDILVQSKRDKRAAKKFFLKLLKGLGYIPARDYHRTG